MVRGHVHGGRQIGLSSAEVVRAVRATSISFFLFRSQYLCAIPKAEELFLSGMEAGLVIPAVGIGPP